MCVCVCVYIYIVYTIYYVLTIDIKTKCLYIDGINIHTNYIQRILYV